MDAEMMRAAVHPSPRVRVCRALRTAHRRWREVRMFGAAMASRNHPVLAQIVPIRRCNLACAYCNEYDRHSHPVPTGDMLARIDRLADLGASIIMLSGGEPLLHPDVGAMIRRIRAAGAIAGVITNGYPLTAERIGTLNDAGLDYLQLSIDNIAPDRASKKSLTTLNGRLERLAGSALFAVTINTVLGAGLPRPEEAVTIARRARDLGFGSTLGILHEPGGQTSALPPRHMWAYEEVRSDETAVFSFAHFDRFQRNLAHGLVNDWRCRAGSRFLYVCENGLVHYCSQQRGVPGIPLDRYTTADLEREYSTEKQCAPRCSVSCAHQVAFLDEVRERPRQMLEDMIDRRRRQNPAFEPPWLLRAAAWAFLDSPGARSLGRLARRVFARRRARVPRAPRRTAPFGREPADGDGPAGTGCRAPSSMSEHGRGPSGDSIRPTRSGWRPHQFGDSIRRLEVRAWPSGLHRTNCINSPAWERWCAFGSSKRKPRPSAGCSPA